jgi:hypothetical protein
MEVIDYLIGEHRKDMRARGEGICGACGNEEPLEAMEKGRGGTLICAQCNERLAEFGPWWMSRLDAADKIALLDELDAVIDRYRDQVDLA